VKPRDPAADPRAFAARVRADLHRLLKALADKRYQEGSESIFQRENEWPAERLEREITPYYAEHARIDVTPAARRPHNTFIERTGPRTWQARQRIVDPEGEVDTMLDCVVDLSEPRTEDLPLIELVRIGA
jgi:hypothetical protein